MRKDDVYADIQKKKLWMYLAQINYNAATSPTSLGSVRDLCTETIERLEGLVKEIDEYQSKPRFTGIEVAQEILARVGKPVKI